MVRDSYLGNTIDLSRCNTTANSIHVQTFQDCPTALRRVKPHPEAAPRTSSFYRKDIAEI